MNVALLVYGTAGVVQASSSPQANAVPIYDAGGGLTANAQTVNGPMAAKTLGIAPAGQAAYAVATTVPAGIGYVRASSAGGAFTVTLPPAASVAGQYLTVIKSDAPANLVTVAANAGEFINGASTNTSLAAQYNVLRLYSNGTGWDIV